METKQQLIISIREWVKIDNEIRKLKKEENIRKQEQKRISGHLIEVMRKNEIDEFDLNDGKIMYTKKNVKKPITKRVLLDLLQKYYNGDSQKANDINNFILSNREEKEVESIIRKLYKDPASIPPPQES
jgi:16S rRNA U1498 N3-methylase RsmE